MSLQLVTDVHTELNETFSTNYYFVKGTYEFYHYLCDGFDDRGWGCCYRTLQTICSWMKHNYDSAQNVPSIREIQKILVELEDKPESFLGSRQWIGSFETLSFYQKLPEDILEMSLNEFKVFVKHQLIEKSFYNVNEYLNVEKVWELIVSADKLYDVPSKIIHVNKGEELENIVESLCNHFDKFGSPIMMGGDVDCSSKGVMGVHIDGVNSKLLIVDPHYVGKEVSKECLHRKGWVKWQPVQDFLSTSFYNLCLPQANH